MKHKITGKNILVSIFVIVMLAVMLLSAVSCEEMGFPSSTPQETPEQEPVKTPAGTVVNSRDTAVLAVYQHLLELAGSYEAKIYLSDFYTFCDNWNVQSDYFKDGSGTWYVTVDMTETEEWEYRTHWQQASWLAFRDGKVIPFSDFNANALRIEADIQSLSAETAE